MRKFFIRLTVACLSLLLGLIISQLFKLVRTAPATEPPAPCATPTPTPEPQPLSEDIEDNEYPETKKLIPWEISMFIDNHPQAKLKRLWERLGIKPELDFVSDFSECDGCNAEVSYYDLDNEPGDEALLRIEDELQESYRYLILKQVRTSSEGDWKLLGHVDARGKYRPSQALVLASGGYNWLVVQGQTASGSGVALYNTRLYELTSKGIKLVVDYESEGYQSSFEAWPTKWFTSKIISCENNRGRSVATVEFTVDYSVWSKDDKEVSLFVKRQIAVFEKTSNHKAVLNTTRSSVSNHELKSVYYIDSMTDVDFLQYNYDELVKLATHGNRDQRLWLKSYLKQYAVNSEQQRKLTALAK